MRHWRYSIEWHWSCEVRWFKGVIAVHYKLSRFFTQTPWIRRVLYIKCWNRTRDFQRAWVKSQKLQATLTRARILWNTTAFRIGNNWMIAAIVRHVVYQYWNGNRSPSFILESESMSHSCRASVLVIDREYTPDCHSISSFIVSIRTPIFTFLPVWSTLDCYMVIAVSLNFSTKWCDFSALPTKIIIFLLNWLPSSKPKFVCHARGQASVKISYIRHRKTLYRMVYGPVISTSGSVLEKASCFTGTHITGFKRPMHSSRTA
jgi:hypothetical protein